MNIQLLFFLATAHRNIIQGYIGGIIRRYIFFFLDENPERVLTGPCSFKVRDESTATLRLFPPAAVGLRAAGAFYKEKSQGTFEWGGKCDGKQSHMCYGGTHSCVSVSFSAAGSDVVLHPPWSPVAARDFKLGCHMSQKVLTILLNHNCFWRACIGDVL